MPERDKAELVKALRKERGWEEAEASEWAELLWEHPRLARRLILEASRRVEVARRDAESAVTGEQALRALGRVNALKEYHTFLKDLEERRIKLQGE